MYAYDFCHCKTREKRYVQNLIRLAKKMKRRQVIQFQMYWKARQVMLIMRLIVLDTDK